MQMGAELRGFQRPTSLNNEPGRLLFDHVGVWKKERIDVAMKEMGAQGADFSDDALDAVAEALFPPPVGRQRKGARSPYKPGSRVI